jgi:DNA-binding NtrC family response regulator
VPPAPLGGLHLSYKNSKNNDNNSNDNDYKNNSLVSSLTLQIEESNNDKNNNNDKWLARLLVVDDESDIVQVIKLGLQKNRFLVSAFTNPEEALQNFQSNSEGYCLMLSDIRMPRMSGIQLAKKVKEINPDVKTVLMTAFEVGDIEFSKGFPSTHVDGFVQKPIGLSDLTNKILSIIGETQEEAR